jgi:polyprenyldihydroxybenzoate methyltransferase / 3-demethylubiquinol 3-O-methyltransferase
MNLLRHDHQFLFRPLRSKHQIYISRYRLRRRDLLIFSSPAPVHEIRHRNDPTSAVIAIAKAHQRSDPALSEPKLRYLNCAIEDLPLPLSSDKPAVSTAADIITLFEVLEHINSPAQFLQTTIPHLRPGGWLIGSTIARSPVSFLTTKVIAEAPVIGVVPPGTHDWNKYINQDELANWFEKDSGRGNWGSMKTQGGDLPTWTGLEDG